MHVYSVVTGAQTTSFNQYGFQHDFPKCNNLISFFERLNEPLIYETWKHHSNNILIDSGAFSFQTGKRGATKMNVEDFFKDYYNWIKKNDEEIIKGFFEFDIDQIIGYDNVLKCREKLFEASDKIIPVWHHTLGVEEFKKMADTYDYIAVSCVGDKDIPETQLKYFVKHAHKKNTKIHGLGMTRKRVLDYVPFDTVDSTSWFRGSRYGRYKGKKLNSEWLRKNHAKITFLEYLENIKFQEYYYKKWRFYHND